MLALVLTLLLHAGQCKADTDCTLRSRCTCDCCHPLEPMTKAEAEAERRRCSTLGPCAPPEGCAQARCAKETPATAVCREGRCAKARAGSL